MALDKISKLVICMEECGELVQACSKVIRHGTSEKKYLDNLISEMGDVIAMCDEVVDAYDLDSDKLDVAILKRHTKMNQTDYE